jgi:hypothetical protein
MQEISQTMDSSNGTHFSTLLSEFVYVRTYARWLDEAKRRETWPETVKRYVDYYVRNNPKLQNLTFDLAGQVEQAILNKDVMPSMRSLWCAGPAMDRDHTCGYNCSFCPIDNLKAFAEALYILMCGTGVGFSVERTFIDCLPTVSAPTGESTSYVIEDSTEGWADSLHYALVEGHRGRKVWFDYSKIRPKGARLRIKGGTASGPEPLERVHNFVASTLEKAVGRRLKPIEAHDIMCMIAEIVMVGGFRRASLISFSDPNDIEMRHAKDWRQGDVPTIRYMANNSAVWFERPNGERFREEWQNLIDSGSGERGFSIMNWDKRAPRGTTELRSNPCVTGDTRVLTASGYKMIQNFLGVQQGIVVDSRFGTEGAGHTTSHGAFKTGEREVFELTTQEGYKLKLTGDHKVMTPNGWVPAGKLAAGDKIHILNQGGGWGHSGSKELGAIAGWLAGDGCLLDGGTAARLYFYGEKRELVLRFFDYLNGGRLTTQDNQDRDYIDFKEAFQVLEISSKTEVPNLVWEGTKACQAAYLSALFSADGSIQGTQKKGISVRLSSVDLEHLRNVQLLLLNFGIYSKIYQNRQDAGYRMLPDGRGGLAEYACQAAHELVIANAGVQTYSTEIGFMLRHKAERLATVLSAFRRRPNTVKYLATVESLVSQGVQTVYDLTENTTHSFSANGIVVHNCHEIGLRFRRALNPWTGEGGGGQFCNLSATVVRPWDTQQTLAHKVRLATWLGCIQASYTHFPYLRPAWKQLCDEDRLLGVDLTGQCDNPELTNNEGVLTSLNAVARMTAAHASMTLDIREPVAITCGKPSGNSSQLANCASGFHPRYAPYYFRHVRVSAKDPLFKMIRDYGVPVFKENGQEHLPDDQVDVWVVRFPVKSPEGAMLRDHETALEQCERYLRIMRTWCGIKGHNQSATIYVRPDEWWPVGQWLYRHFDEVTGLSFLPHSDADTKYRLLPYQEITKEQYEEALAALPYIDFKALKMYETDDEGEGASEPACVGGACEL